MSTSSLGAAGGSSSLDRTLALMVNFADRAKNPSIGQARTVSSLRDLPGIMLNMLTGFWQVLNILQTHCTLSNPARYVERMLTVCCPRS